MSTSLKIAAAAHDTGGQKVLSGVVDSLRSRDPDFTVDTFLSQKNAEASILLQGIEASIAEYRALLIGGPSSKDPVELEIARRFKNRTGGQGTVFLIEDSPGTSRRAAEQKDLIDAVIVAQPQAKQWAEERGFGSAQYFGAPAHWADDFRSMDQAVYAKRPMKRLPSGEIRALDADDMVIGLSGGKSLPALLTEVASEVRRSMESLNLLSHLVIDLLPHPGEPKDEDLARARAELLDGISSIAAPGRRTTEAVVQDHLMIFAGAVGPTDSITGSMHKSAAPLAYFYNKDVTSQLERQLGHKRWWPEELGHMLSINRLSEIRSTLKAVLKVRSPDTVLPKMEIPSDWNESSRRIAEFILAQVAK